MSNGQPDELARLKIFPRNLTARADSLVRGNPASTRPESGVDNCYPGLEFDQRNLERAFFPGLVFEFHRGEGAIVVSVTPGGEPAEAGLADTDLPLYLWALMAPPGNAEPDPIFFAGLSGLEVWRRVHDLTAGPLAVLLAPGPGINAPASDPQLAQALRQARDAGQSLIRRDPVTARLQAAVIAGERARYLDDDGVIDPAAYRPGELTRSLCAPWQYDFRDCGCFYWAATKPDLVTSGDGRHRYLNFQRRDRTSDPPPQDESADSQERRARELDYAELVGGAWNDVLPIVVNDRESERFTPPPGPTIELMTRDRVIEELRYLATVEHALSVEYLFAHYSLDAPMALPAPGATAEQRRIFAAANEVFNIAVDEMRHLRWVNEALDLLGEPPSLGRAERIGRQLDRPFSLEPLTPAQLQWFIDVERPSQELTGTLDGMYVRLHISIDRQPGLFAERERLVHLIKLIIDEGEDHFVRFSSVQRHLNGLSPTVYLRPLRDPSDPSTGALADLADQNYAVVLGTLQMSFLLGDRAGGILLEQARQAMFRLHETSHFLAARNVAPRFLLPPAPPAPPPSLLAAPGAHALVGSLQSSTHAAVSNVAEEVPEPAGRALAQRQLAAHDEMFDLMHRLIDEDLGG